MQKLKLKAAPIWQKNSNHPNSHIVFRKSFKLSSLPSSAETYISVDTKYWLFINGQTVIREGGLFRESIPNGGYADKINISPFLKEGPNTIAIHVWYFGNEGRNNIDSGNAYLIFQCEELNLYSDSSFLCITHPAYCKTAPPYPFYLYGGHNLGFNANNDIDNIYSENCDKKGFEQAIKLDKSVSGDLYLRPIPLHWYSKKETGNYMTKGETKIIMKLPYAMQVHLCFDITAQKDTVIDIRTDRYLVNGGPNDLNTYNSQRIEYVCKEGLNTFESILYLFGEDVIITSDKPIKIEWLGYRESGYSSKIVGKYECSCEVINKLIKKAARTLYVCMRDNFMDCPDRERGQWIGDVSVQAPQVFFMMDKNAQLLLKKAISDFINLRKSNVLVGNVPGANFSELPPQSLNAISELGLISNYYEYTKDKEVIELSFVPCIKYLELWDFDENGLVRHRSGDWAWFDHLYNVDKPVLENAWYYSALKFAKTMSQILKDNSYDNFINSRMAKIEKNFNKTFWKNSLYSSCEVVDDRANALAVLSGLCQKENFSRVRDVLVSVSNSSIYMENYVLSALCEMGFYEDAYHRMVSRYYNLAMNENSTLWEDFYLLGTKNHAWSGAPVNIAFKYFLGIKTSDGFKSYTVNPVENLFDFQKAEFMINNEIIKIDCH